MSEWSKCDFHSNKTRVYVDFFTTNGFYFNNMKLLALQSPEVHIAVHLSTCTGLHVLSVNKYMRNLEYPALGGVRVLPACPQFDFDSFVS